MKEKVKLTFKRLLIILFKITYFLKNFLHALAVLDYLPKSKKGAGTRFWGTFSAWFLHENAPYSTLYQWEKFQCHTFFPSQDIKQNVSLSSYLNSSWHHKLKIYRGLSSKAMADREKKWRRWKCKNLNISRTKRAF